MTHSTASRNALVMILVTVLAGLSFLMAPLTASAATGPPAGSVPVDVTSNPTRVYTEAGHFKVKDRLWWTTCEPYSQTKRCQANIWADQVTYSGGKFTKTTGWAFNNLTYLPLPKETWGTNRLANTGTWTDTNGRKWETQCNTAETGTNACRTWVYSSIVQATQLPGGGYRYAVVNNVRVFNNIVHYAVPGFEPAKIVDKGLRSCIIAQTGTMLDGAIELGRLQKITHLDCSNRAIGTLAGLPMLPNLTDFDLTGNQLTWLTGLPLLPNLTYLNVDGNKLDSLRDLPALAKLTDLHVANNRLKDFQGLPALQKVSWIDFHGNEISSLRYMRSLPDLTELDLSRNRLASPAGFLAQPNLNVLDLTGNRLTSLTGLPVLPRLSSLHLAANQLTTLDGLRSQPSLTRLYANDNVLASLTNMPELPTLTRLNLERNKLTTVAPLVPQARALAYVWLGLNTITDEGPVAELVRRGCTVYR